MNKTYSNREIRDSKIKNDSKTLNSLIIIKKRYFIDYIKSKPKNSNNIFVNSNNNFKAHIYKKVSSLAII